MFYRLLNSYSRRFSFPHRGLKFFLKAAKWFGLDVKTYTKKLEEKFYMRLNPSEHIQQQLFWYGYYEKELGDLLKKIIKPNDIFLDIGANIGYFSLLAATKEPTASVISFEPVKSLFEKLKENILINNIQNINAVKIAVGEKNEEKEIFISGQENLGMSSFRQPENYSGKSEKVNVLTIDEWFKNSGFTNIDIIKLDIEGSELAALKGMEKTLQDLKPAVIVELNQETLSLFGLAPVDILNSMEQLKFKAFKIQKEGRLMALTHIINETINVVFIHEDKMNSYSKLFNH